jgi:predicted ester cyclase
MGQARELMDRMTDIVIDHHNVDGAKDLYAEDAVIATPDMGEIRGRDRIVEYLHGMMDAFPDAHYEPISRLEADGKVVDEVYFVGTNTAPLQGPEGQIEATGRQVKLRCCDIATVRDGKIVEHHRYFDQAEIARQLGLNG